MSLSDEILYGTQDNVERMLSSTDTDINAIDEYGYTPLIEAAIVNKTTIVKLLLDHGALVDEPDMTGSTVLHWAVENNNMDLCRLLLEKGADANAYTKASQPLLVKPLLRGQDNLKELLYRHGADLTFAQDYINTKLIGHRFELIGKVYIVNAQGKYVELDLEGFILEFTMGLVEDSLRHFKKSFATRHLQPSFRKIQKIIDALHTASQLIKYQQYLIDIREHQSNIDQLLNQKLLILPVGYEGHAISFVRFGDLLAKVDRGENSLREPSVVIYQMQKPQAFNKDFIKYLLYTKHSKQFISRDINDMLRLKMIADLPLTSQITGNCSWANINGAMPTALMLLGLASSKQTDLDVLKDEAMALYTQWVEWDRDWSLHRVVESFYNADAKRKHTLAALLGAVLFQAIDADNRRDMQRANKIMAILSLPKYRYIIESYLKVYTQRRAKAGKHFKQLLDICGF